MDSEIQPPGMASRRRSWREIPNSSFNHHKSEYFQPPVGRPRERHSSPDAWQTNFFSKRHAAPVCLVIESPDAVAMKDGNSEVRKTSCCVEGQRVPSFAASSLEDIVPDSPTGNTNLLPSPMPLKTKLQHSSLICKDILYNALFIALYFMVLYAYTMAGGAVLVSLDNDYLQTMAAREAEVLVDHGFDSLQLEFLANHSIPRPPIVLSVFDGQQYALQLSTTIGYGNITSRSAAARWFAVFFSMVGILFVGYLLLRLGPCLFRIYVRIAVLFLVFFCPSKLTYGKVQASAPKDQPGTPASPSNDNTLTLWKVRQLMASISPSPSWDKVCTMVIKAADEETQVICPLKVERLLEEYAKDVLEEEQMGWNSWVGFKFALLLVWMLLGAAFYSTQCTCMTSDFGTALYFVFITLTTIGTGDYTPCGTACEQFWFFHSVAGLGMMAVVIQIAACKLVETFRVPSTHRMDLTGDYGLNLRGSSPQQFSVLVELCKAVAIILAYCMVGGAIFYAYETAAPSAPDFNEQGFTAAQLKFLMEKYALVRPTWTFLAGVNFTFECITTLGYGYYYLTSSGGRTFAVFFILCGLGLMGLKLEYLAATIRKVLHLCCGAIAHCLRRPIFAMEHDEKLLQSLESAFDYAGAVLEGENQTALPDWEFPSELQCASPGVYRTLSTLSVDAETPQLEPSLVFASLPLARLYHSTMMRCAVRELLGALVLMLLLIGISIPVFVTAEGWTVGDAAWFSYIASTTIGLGDLLPLTTLGVCWWYFMVLATIGHISVFLPSLMTVYQGLVAKKTLSATENKS